jgi:hypothetical protein
MPNFQVEIAGSAERPARRDLCAVGPAETVPSGEWNAKDRINQSIDEKYRQFEIEKSGVLEP